MVPAVSKLLRFALLLLPTVAFVVVAAAAAALPALVHAQAFPTKQINIVVPYAPGGQTDILARHVQRLLAFTTAPASPASNDTEGGSR